MYDGAAPVCSNVSNEGVHCDLLIYCFHRPTGHLVADFA
jgi:hypothetical protein